MDQLLVSFDQYASDAADTLDAVRGLLADRDYAKAAELFRTLGDGCARMANRLQEAAG